MWIPKIISVKRDGNQLKILVGFLSDDGNSTSSEYSISTFDLVNLKASIKNQVDILNAQDNINLPLGAIDVTPLVLTQAQIDQNQFIQDYQLWIQVKKAIDNGVLTGNEAAVVALKSKVQSEFKPLYLNLL